MSWLTRWATAMGDSGALGWVTLLAYLATALICVRATRLGGRRDRFFWATLAAAMLLLGLNKQLDAQTLLTQVARGPAIAQGWYGRHRPFQLGFVLLLGLAAAIAIALLWKWGRRRGRGIRMALLGLTCLGLFILVRAASFHHADRLLGMRAGALSLYSALELAAIMLVGIGAAIRPGGRRSGA